jgi:hypothetical protein
MKPIEIQNLDQHLKPLQVDGVSTGIEISTEGLRFTGGTLEVENLVSKKTDHEGDLTIQGDLYLEDTDGSTIYLVGGQKIDSKDTDDYITMTTTALLVKSATDYTDADCKIFVAPDSGYDSQITFMEGAGVNWSIGNDGSETPIKLSFSNNATLGTDEKMSLDTNGLLTVAGDIVAGDDIAVAATGKLSLDGIGGHTYIYEQADDVLRVIVGGDIIMHITEQGDDGNQVMFSDASVGFVQKEPTYDATNTDVDFRFSNKQNLTFGAGNITNLKIYFPDMSGNFQLLLKQDGTGSRTITNYKTYESDESATDGAVGVIWAGGSNPTLTTDANHVDILSFYYDADNEIAYGVATLDFQF